MAWLGCDIAESTNMIWLIQIIPAILIHFQSRYSTSPSFSLRSIKPRLSQYLSGQSKVPGLLSPGPSRGVDPSATFLRLIVQHTHHQMKTVRISIGLLCVAPVGSFPNLCDGFKVAMVNRSQFPMPFLCMHNKTGNTAAQMIGYSIYMLCQCPKFNSKSHNLRVLVIGSKETSHKRSAAPTI